MSEIASKDNAHPNSPMSVHSDGANPHPAASIFPLGCTRWRPALLTNIPRMQGLVEPDYPVELHVRQACFLKQFVFLILASFQDALMWGTAAPVYFPIRKIVMLS